MGGGFTHLQPRHHWSLKDGRGPHSRPDAHGDHAVALLCPVELVHERAYLPRSL
jgi:hypothetical protein